MIDDTLEEVARDTSWCLLDKTTIIEIPVSSTNCTETVFGNSHEATADILYNHNRSSEYFITKIATENHFEHDIFFWKSIMG